MATLKTCFKCGVGKPRTEFYRHPQMGDGLLGKCKPCAMLDVRKRREVNHDYYVEFDRKRGATPERKAKTIASFKAASKRHPERKRANTKVANAIRAGKIVRQPCWVCGGEKVEAHHADYSRPFDIVWLCVMHHRATHAIMLRADLKS